MAERGAETQTERDQKGRESLVRYTQRKVACCRGAWLCSRRSFARFFIHPGSGLAAHRAGKKTKAVAGVCVITRRCVVSGFPRIYPATPRGWSCSQRCCVEPSRAFVGAARARASPIVHNSTKWSKSAYTTKVDVVAMGENKTRIMRRGTRNM